ncbi:DUF1634 domain-containing protein [Bradyrhizobium sp. Leo121]|uniref:DUF1634 domain-containing protein n=1 Tax=Bradyrhizobium sp. Leo121 TaxID=1571195 RepID=UPI00102943B1|nr:DUF1634 domain-containing protein [Bradyrhizobium sp. Leo121]RZN14169.1 DUF1634 domain-containing protein [Bradyrhizobium sp. Leo121]
MIADDKALDETRRMDRLLARQLKYGIWLASGVTALGMIVALFGRCIVPHGHTMTLGTSIVGKGIALIILLPILRVILMLIVFLRERDYLFGTISGIVLITIGVSVVAGLYGPAIH